MSYHNMLRVACFVAGDVMKYHRSTIETMIEQSDWETVHDFFESYQRTYHADVSKQLEWIEEIVEEMEV